MAWWEGHSARTRRTSLTPHSSTLYSSTLALWGGVSRGEPTWAAQQGGGAKPDEGKQGGGKKMLPRLLGDVLAEHVVHVEEVVRVSGRRSSGSFGSGRTAGYAIGEDRTSPWLEAIAGIRERSCPRLGSKPVPAPRTRPEVWCGLRHGFSPAMPATQAPFRAPEKVVRVNPFQAVVRVNPFRKEMCAGKSNVQCAGKMCGAVLKGALASNDSGRLNSG